MDRLILLQLLPQQGDLTTLRLVRDLQGVLSFSEEEHAALGFVQSEERVTWNSEAEVVKDVHLGARMQVLLLDKLKELDKNEELKLDLLDVCDKLGYDGAADE
jgi:hypothetical protein